MEHTKVLVIVSSSVSRNKHIISVQNSILSNRKQKTDRSLKFIGRFSACVFPVLPHKALTHNRYTPSLETTSGF